MVRHLYRSTDEKVVSGVCGGLGEYFEVDPNLVRVVAVLLFFATKGFAIAAYIVGWIIIPKKPVEAEEVEHPIEPRHSSWNRYLPGLLLIGLGCVMLMWQQWPWFDFAVWWPVLLILFGLFLIFRRQQRRDALRSLHLHQQESDLKNGGTVS